MRIGTPQWAGPAAEGLGELLAGLGQGEAAKEVWQQLLASGNADEAGGAFVSLVNAMRDDGDPAQLRAAYEKAAVAGNPEALYALDQLGEMQHQGGDVDGAHATWREAIDAGYENADILRERISPAPRPRDEPYPPDLPPEFSPRSILRTAAAVLDHGLPALPETLAYQMAIPVAYWKADRCGVVLVLEYSRGIAGEIAPMGMMLAFTLGDDGTWVPPGHANGMSFHYDPIADRDSRHDLGSRMMVYGGQSTARTVVPRQPASIATGRAAPEIAYLAVVQDGREVRRRLDSHFGAWIICTEQAGPYQVAGYDSDGTLRATLGYPFPPPRE
jgi:tetratricopeptide (TPR) repeat protein